MTRDIDDELAAIVREQCSSVESKLFAVNRVMATGEECERMRLAAARFIPSVGCVLGWYADVPRPIEPSSATLGCK